MPCNPVSSPPARCLRESALYEIIDQHMPHTIGIRVGGGIQEADFVRLRDQMAGILDEHAPLNTVFICDESVEIQPAVLWDDMNFIQGRSGQLGRMALVAGEDWRPIVEIVTEAGFTSRYFTHAELDAAWEWARNG